MPESDDEVVVGLDGRVGEQTAADEAGDQGGLEQRRRRFVPVAHPEHPANAAHQHIIAKKNEPDYCRDAYPGSFRRPHNRPPT
jgi:hypothetical protein